MGHALGYRNFNVKDESRNISPIAIWLGGEELHNNHHADPHSATFHIDQTKVQDGTFVRVMAWYDNEWGFSNRMADTAVAMGKLI